jgi:hypothetical protein
MIGDDVMTKFEVIFRYEQMLQDVDLKEKPLCGLECMLQEVFTTNLKYCVY